MEKSKTLLRILGTVFIPRFLFQRLVSWAESAELAWNLKVWNTDEMISSDQSEVSYGGLVNSHAEGLWTFPWPLFCFGCIPLPVISVISHYVVAGLVSPLCHLLFSQRYAQIPWLSGWLVALLQPLRLRRSPSVNGCFQQWHWDLRWCITEKWDLLLIIELSGNQPRKKVFFFFNGFTIRFCWFIFCLAIGLMVDIWTYLDLGNAQLEGPCKKLQYHKRTICLSFFQILFDPSTVNMGFI